MSEKLIPFKTSIDGKGMVLYENKTRYISGIIEGEEGTFEVSNGQINLSQVIKPSNVRTKPKCSVYDACGGCSFLHVNYDYELKVKQEYIELLFKKYTNNILPIIKLDSPYNYRNKCHMVFSKKNNQTYKIRTSFYEEDSHKLVDVSTCALHDKVADEIILNVTNALSKAKISVYDERRNTGFLKHIIVRVAKNTGETMVILVASDNRFQGKNNFLKYLDKKNITTVIHNINPQKTSVVLGPQSQSIYGPGFIYDKLFDLKIKIGPNSFYQVNTRGMEQLYSKALELADIKKTDVVLDTYCGIGTIGLLASKNAKTVYGVELNSNAIKDANINKKINNINNITFICEDSTKFMTTLNRNEKIDVVIMDPPRQGSTKEFIDAINKLGVKKVVYISCGIDTLGRDLEIFVDNGYKVETIVGVDMFARTKHVETIVLMSRV